MEDADRMERRERDKRERAKMSMTQNQEPEPEKPCLFSAPFRVNDLTLHENNHLINMRYIIIENQSNRKR